MTGPVLLTVRLLWAGAALLCLTQGVAAQEHASLIEIERSLRGKPSLAIAAVERLLPSLGGADKIEALFALGLWHVRTQTLDAAEASAREIDRLGPHEPLAKGVAGVLRAKAAARNSTATRADRLMSEALTLLPE